MDPVDIANNMAEGFLDDISDPNTFMVKFHTTEDAALFIYEISRKYSYQTDMEGDTVWVRKVEIPDTVNVMEIARSFQTRFENWIDEDVLRISKLI
jgi:hypothetical protein